ncbi:YSC84-related protein [Comamonas testosteroni]|jgi:lipid-binding SYLF domain-containing protein|uniref:Putative lipoprotein n=1 Tax=Comamonas testosteroni (strain DSM 14576 / KF-1) TaxID=399795 RepID=B7WXI1_COMTK|nr:MULTISPECIES: YSC84-related protein [Comamonas]EED66004.1 putative lipoprotein [Comamonas testosteroni KF-1]TYK67651.1 twin-arginine translocation pathway signal [Comamonas sp. Z3]WQG69385.1 YSC84-related protein [Comamonas testosteroni]
MRQISLRSVAMAAALAAGAMTMTACTTTKPETAAAPRADATTINTRANAALERLYQTAPGSKEMVQRAKGVLIFPSVIGGSFVVGVEHGRGVLRVGGQNRGFYSTTAASIGWQAGGQSKAVIYVFNTQEALDKFLRSDGWSVGADATVAAGRIGANGSVDTTTAQAPVTSYVLTNAGLEAGVSLQGTKITKVVE